MECSIKLPIIMIIVWQEKKSREKRMKKWQDKDCGRSSLRFFVYELCKRYVYRVCPKIR